MTSASGHDQVVWIQTRHVSISSETVFTRSGLCTSVLNVCRNSRLVIISAWAAVATHGAASCTGLTSSDRPTSAEGFGALLGLKRWSYRQGGQRNSITKTKTVLTP